MYTCGIDIGEINMAIAFVARGSSSTPRCVINYRGAVTRAKATSTHGVIEPHLVRYEIGAEPLLLTPVDTSSDQACLCQFLESIPEFKETEAVVIEMQLAANKSNMSRLDGICYGWLQARYANRMLVWLKGSTCRKKAVSDLFKASSIEIDTIEIPAVPKKHESKIPSYKYVKAFHPESWGFFREMGLKLDDVCDTLVYAAIAYSEAHPVITSRSKKQPPQAGFKPVTVTKLISKPEYDSSDDDVAPSPTQYDDNPMSLREEADEIPTRPVRAPIEDDFDLAYE